MFSLGPVQEGNRVILFLRCVHLSLHTVNMFEKLGKVRSIEHIEDRKHKHYYESRMRRPTSKLQSTKFKKLAKR